MVDEQNRFISDASHELRTPLTALKSSLEVFLRDKNADLKGAKDLIQDSLKDIDTLSSLTTSLLELSQIQNKVDVQTASELHSSTVVNRAVSKVSPLALAKNITINSKSEETLFKGDETAIIEILIILLDNAIKYSPDNSLVNVSSYKKDGNVFFEVQDFGIGISEKDLPQIFNRFYRVNTSRSADKPSGFGLGLSIAQKLVTLCGGVITVKSELAKGSTFIVKLPTSHNLHI
jgi:signal transduction histidine kinase